MANDNLRHQSERPQSGLAGRTHALIILAMIMITLYAPCQAAGNDTPRTKNVYFAEAGRLIRTGPAGKAEVLTSGAKDRSPLLSPDGTNLVFLRKSTNQAVLVVGSEEDYSADEILADQVWTMDVRTRKTRLLVADRGNDGANVDTSQVIAHIDEESLHFSPDGRLLYFISSAWVTSGALHVVNMASVKERFLLDANDIDVVTAGEYAGHIIVRQHRYFLAGGSYDWWWLFTPEGHEVGPVGETIEQVEEFHQLYSE